MPLPPKEWTEGPLDRDSDGRLSLEPREGPRDEFTWPERHPQVDLLPGGGQSQAPGCALTQEEDPHCLPLQTCSSSRDTGPKAAALLFPPRT